MTVRDSFRSTSRAEARSVKPSADPSAGLRDRFGVILVVAALAWSIAYLTAATLWAAGAPGFPFRAPPHAELHTVIETLPTAFAAPLIAIVTAIGVVIAMWMLGSWRVPASAGSPARGRTTPGPLPAVYAGALVVFVIVALTDARVIAFAGYLFSLRWPVPTPDVLHQALMVAGSALWIAAAYAWSRRSVALPVDGTGARGAHASMVGRPVRRSARVAVAIAVVVPCIYAVTRFLWLFGIPFGISDEMLREGQDHGQWWTGAGLGLVAVGGAVLTLGLVQRWGEVFPRWIPGLRGRTVPALLAIVPASGASILIMAGGLTFCRVILTGQLPLAEHLTTIGPELLWPVWSIALAAATWMYHRRRTRA